MQPDRRTPSRIVKRTSLPGRFGCQTRRQTGQHGRLEIHPKRVDIDRVFSELSLFNRCPECLEIKSLKMVNIGICGIGFMGMIHYLAAQSGAASVVALCSRDAKKLAGDWTSIQGNFGPRGTQMDLSGVGVLPRIRGSCWLTRRSTWSTCAFPTTRMPRWRFRHFGPASTCWSKSRSRSRPQSADEMVETAQRCGKTAHGRSRPAVFPRVRVCPRRGSIRTIRRTQGGSLAARDFEAGLVQRDRRSRAQRRAGHRSAYP